MSAWGVGPPTPGGGCERRMPSVVGINGHTADLRPPKIRSTKETLGGHWQRLDFGTPAITWLTCWPQPDHVALPHLRQVTCRHIGRSSWIVDRNTESHYTPRGLLRLPRCHRPATTAASRACRSLSNRRMWVLSSHRLLPCPSRPEPDEMSHLVPATT